MTFYFTAARLGGWLGLFSSGAAVGVLFDRKTASHPSPSMKQPQTGIKEQFNDKDGNMIKH